MKALSDHLSPVLSNYLASNHKVEIEQFEFQHTRKEFEGDITLVVFSLLRHIKANPVALGEAIGAYLVETVDYVTAFNVVKGFLNLSIQDSFYVSQLKEIKETAQFGHVSIQKDKGGCFSRIFFTKHKQTLALRAYQEQSLGLCCCSNS